MGHFTTRHGPLAAQNFSEIISEGHEESHLGRDGPGPIVKCSMARDYNKGKIRF